jgi:hypothetical protein
MKFLLTAITLASVSLGLGCKVWAQATPSSPAATQATQAPFAADPKLEWASKVVTLQQGPDMDRLVANLASGTTQDMINNWQPRLQANVAKPQQAKATTELNTELQKYADEVSKIIRSKLQQVGSDALVPAYMARFTLEELKQIAGFLQAPAIQKYQSIAPELGSIFTGKLVEVSRAEVIARAQLFDEAAARIVGPAPTAAATPATPAVPAAPTKPAASTAKPAKK